MIKFTNNKLKIQEISINDIKMYENNPRNNDEEVKYVANSIKKFGFKVPVIIDKNHTIIAGHTRFKAAKKLNIENLPCLMCGDSTIFNDIEKLINGNLANLLLTDPPYNVNYKSKSTNMKIKNDNQNEDSFYQFLYYSFSNIYSFLKDDASFYVWYALKKLLIFQIA